MSYAIAAPTVRWGVECESAQCTTGNGTGNFAGVDLHAARVTVEDPVAPALETVGEVVRPGQLTVAARDSAGVRSLQAVVDGAAQRLVDARVRLPARGALSGAGGGVAHARRGAPHGALRAEDAAGNPAAVERAVVADGTAPVLERVS